MKICARRGESKPETEFARRARMKSGLHSWCKACSAERMRQWRAENPDYVAAANEARRAVPRERPGELCGTPFTGRVDKRYCSRRCRDERHRDRDRESLGLCSDMRNGDDDFRHPSG
jgi:hypothetical protein